ncbi:MAG: type II toxin-antitoxin system HicB family antitoxin [Xenococcaceae cyanobacterium]
MKSETNNFNRFTINLFQDEDGDWLAHFIEMPNVSAFADNPNAALEELQIAWEGVKESYRKHGEAIPSPSSQKDYSGQFNIRIEKRIHRLLAMEAAEAGISLNAIVSQKLARDYHDILAIEKS